MRRKRISVAQFICQVFQDYYEGWKVLFHDAMSEQQGENANDGLIPIVSKPQQVMILLWSYSHFFILLYLRLQSPDIDSNSKP